MASAQYREHKAAQAVTTGVYDALSLMQALTLTPDPMQAQTVAAAQRGEDVLVLAHRQRGKSLITAAIALADAVQVPGSLDILVSRSLRQSQELLRKVKTFHHQTQPLTLVKDTEHELEYSNGSRIISLPASADTIVGFSSVHRLILEEAARIPDPTYYAVRPMLARSGGSVLAITTPFGRRGWFHEAWTESPHDDAHADDLQTVERLLADLDFPIGEYSDAVARGDVQPDTHKTYQWTRIFAPATYAPRLSPRYIAHERGQVPDLWFRQEWLCEFVELGNIVFRYDDLMALASERQPFTWGGEGTFDAGAPDGIREAFTLGGNGWMH